MPYISELEELLTKNISDISYVFDRRNISDRLAFMQQYTALVPFTDGKAWNDFFFRQTDKTFLISKLAGLYQNTESANGLTPPEQAVILAFNAMLETPTALFNHLPAMHRDLYYRSFLQLKLKDPEASQVALKFTIDDSITELMIPAGTLMDAGQDSAGNTVSFALDQDILINHCRWTDLNWTLRLSSESGLHIKEVYSLTDDKPWPEQGTQFLDTDTKPATTGRIIGSPVLAMASGERYIKVTFASATDIDKALISSGEEWLELNAVSESSTVWLLRLDPDAAAISPPLEGSFAENIPFLRLEREDGNEIPKVTQIEVQVFGLADLAYRTSDGTSDLNSSNYPFGSEPLLGSAFTLMSSDWLQKKGIDINLTLTPRWAGLPNKSFKEWYSEYGSDITSNDNFKVQPFVTTRIGKTKIGDPLNLFGGGSDSAPDSQNLTFSFNSIAGNAVDSDDPIDWAGWLRLELAGHDFLHDEYQQLVSSKPNLNRPYTPQLESMGVSWKATVEPTQQYVITAFGYSLSETDESYVGAVLYLGFDSITPGQDITLFWNLRPTDQFKINWEYLTDTNEWKTMNAYVEDNTNGWSRSGVWKAVLPKDASDISTLMPKGRYWIRGKTDYEKESPWVIDIYTNAMSATLQNVQNLADDFFDQPLPAQTITDPMTNILGLASVEQPIASYGGKPKETDQVFHQRIAHRLRHRDRASTWQDIRDLLLDNFSEIYSVQTPQQNQDIHTEQQTVVALPKGGEMDNGDTLRPAFSKAKLASMSAFLQERASLWANIVVSNADYEDVKVTYDITFTEGLNADYGYRRLQTDLTNIYMPWVVNNELSPVTGNRVDYYELMGEILRLPYVQQIKNFKLNDTVASVEAGNNQVLILDLPDSSSTATGGA